MTIEELKKEAEESFEKYRVTDEDYVVSPYSDDMGEKMLMFNYEYEAEETYLRLYTQGYFAGAEPREKRIAELEKENAELKRHIGLTVECEKAQKNGKLCLGYGGDEDEPCEQCKNCIKCECGYYQLGETEKDRRLEELEKENSELKKLKRECETSLCRAEYQYNYEQLTKSKEIIKKLINACCYYGATGRATAEAEQFLSKVEK